MGALVDGDKDGKISIEKDDPDENVASSPVVYRLVRVDVDGRLTPATDDELIEVKHVVEDDGKLVHNHSVQQPELCTSSEKDDDTCFCRPSENVEVDSKKIVFKVDVDTLFIQPDISDACAENPSTEACSEGKNAVNEMAEQSFSENYSSLKPNFSLLEGEIRLDDFSIRELQEAFRATFGRFTSVKDKLWLKRRIAMGLTNSCDIPSTNFIIKDNKIVLSNVSEDINSRTQSNMPYPGYLMMNKSTTATARTSLYPTMDPLNEILVKNMSGTAGRIEEQQESSSKGPQKSLKKCNDENVNTQMLQCGAKRIRRPTKRYIEEHSEVEVTGYVGRVASLSKIDIHDRHSLKSKVLTRSLADAKQDLLGGYHARIPSVIRVRRRPPRKNFLALVNFVHMEREEKNPEVLNGEKSPQEMHEKPTSSGGAEFHENSDTVQPVDSDTVQPLDSDTVQPVEASLKRKHHRAWSLGEVLKLIDGVSRYGAGRWSQIRQVAFASDSNRTSVDLKDKWRNLLKASFAQAPTDEGKLFRLQIGNSRKPVSLPIPAPILMRVRELAADRRSHSGMEFGSSQLVGYDGIVQEKETGFL